MLKRLYSRKLLWALSYSFWSTLSLLYLSQIVCLFYDFHCFPFAHTFYSNWHTCNTFTSLFVPILTLQNSTNLSFPFSFLFSVRSCRISTFSQFYLLLKGSTAKYNFSTTKINPTTVLFMCIHVPTYKTVIFQIP